MPDFVVAVPETHIERRYVKDAKSPEDAVRLATKTSRYRTEGTTYDKPAPITEATPLLVRAASTGELLVGFTYDPTNAQETPMAKPSVANTVPEAPVPTIVMEAQAPGRIKQLANTLLDDTKSAAYRVAAEEAVETVKAPLQAALLKQFGLQEDSIVGKGVAKFMGTRMGDGALRLGLSVLFPMIEGSLPANVRSHAAKMGQELRVSGIHNIAQPVVQAVTGPLRTMMVLQIEQMGMVETAPAEIPAKTETVVIEAPVAKAA